MAKQSEPHLRSSGAIGSRVAVVTGAGQGLGRAYCLTLAERGFAVAVNNRVHAGMPSSAQLVVDEITANGGTAFAHGGSVDDREQAVDLIEATIARYGRLDALICNAGINLEEDFATADPADVTELVNINLWGAVYPLQRAWRHMLETGYGRVVLTGSPVGLYGHGGIAMYGATRAAMVGLARSLAHEAPADADIGINVILPVAYTRLSTKHMSAEAGAMIPPKAVSQAVAWLCSEGCTVSGQIFHSGGGRVSRVGVIESASIPVESLDNDAVFGGAMGLLPENEPKSASEASGRMISGQIGRPDQVF